MRSTYKSCPKFNVCQMKWWRYRNKLKLWNKIMWTTHPSVYNLARHGHGSRSSSSIPSTQGGKFGIYTPTIGSGAASLLACLPCLFASSARVLLICGPHRPSSSRRGGVIFPRLAEYNAPKNSVSRVGIVRNLSGKLQQSNCNYGALLLCCCWFTLPVSLW